jgi:hypothetical protein
MNYRAIDAGMSVDRKILLRSALYPEKFASAQTMRLLYCSKNFTGSSNRRLKIVIFSI